MGKIDDLLAGNQTNAMNDVTGEEAMKHLVGEGAKYATVEDMAKAMLNGQVHISQIEKENAGFRDSNTQAKGVDDILAAIAASGKQVDGNHQDDDNHQKGGAADEPSVAEQIATALEQRDAGRVKEKSDANVLSVVAKLEELYGAEALTIYKKVGDELGLNLSELAEKSPAAVLKLVADARPASSNNQGLQQSTVNTTTHQVQGGVMNSTAIDKMFADGKLSRHEKIALENEMLTQMGSAFFN